MAAGGQTGGMGGAQTAAPGGGTGVSTGQPPAMGSMQMPSYMQQPMMGMMGGYGGMRGGMQQPMMGGYGQSPFMGGGFGGDYGGYGQSPFMGGMRGPRGGMGFNPYGGGMGFNPYGGIDRAYDGSPARDFMFRAQSMPASPQNFQTNPQQLQQIQQLINQKQASQGTLVGFGPTDAPIYSNDPNAVPYTGLSMGGRYVNGVPVQPGQQPPQFNPYNNMGSLAMMGGLPMKQGGIASLIKK
jgi:hypothetical protein